MTVRPYFFSFFPFILAALNIKANCSFFSLLIQQNANWWSWDFGGLAENGTPIAGGAAGSQTQPQATP